MTCTAASAYARLLRKYFERFSKVQADGIWGGGTVIGPPYRSSFNLSQRSWGDPNREHADSGNAAKPFEEVRGANGLAAIGFGDGSSQFGLEFSREIESLFAIAGEHRHDRPLRQGR